MPAYSLTVPAGWPRQATHLGALVLMGFCQRGAGNSFLFLSLSDFKMKGDNSFPLLLPVHDSELSCQQIICR